MKKTILYIFIGLSIVGIGGYFYINHYVKSKVEEFLADQLSPELSFDYDGLTLNTFSGKIAIDGIQVALKNQTDTIVHTKASIDHLELSGFGYWEFLFSDQIEFDQIEIDKNNLVYYKDRFISASKSDTIKQSPLASINKSILIKSLDIGDTSLTIYDETQDSVVLHVSKTELSVKEIRTDQSVIKKRIPLTYGNIHMVSDSLYMKISPYESLSVNNLDLKNEDIAIKDLKISPKYSKAEYSRILPKERDYTILEIPSVDILGYDFGFKDSKLFTTASKIEIQEPDLTIYRNKLVKDDLSFKPLYSKMLRDLKIDLMVDSIKVSNSHIVYEEKVKADKPSGSIEFTNLDLDLSTVGNTQLKGEKTTITANGDFQQSKLHVDWSFDVHDTSDAFRFSGSIGRLPASNINSFVKPNLNVGFEGVLEEIYFDISGNNSNSQTNMKMAYEDFKIELMKKDGLGINKLLSGIANIFVAKDSKQDGGDYREGKGDADRNKNQSVFNFIWVSLLSGLIKTMT